MLVYITTSTLICTTKIICTTAITVTISIWRNIILICPLLNNFL